MFKKFCLNKGATNETNNYRGCDNFTKSPSAFGQDKNQKDTQQAIAQMEQDFLYRNHWQQTTDFRTLYSRLGVAFDVVEMKNRVYDNAAVVVGTAVVKFKQADNSNLNISRIYATTMRPVDNLKSNILPFYPRIRLAFASTL